MFNNDNIEIKTNHEIENIMIASNCNTLLNACDYSDEWQCLAFASSNLIHIYDTHKIKSYLTLKSHSQRVNSVRWLNNNFNQNVNFIIKNNSHQPLLKTQNYYPALLTGQSAIG